MPSFHDTEYLKMVHEVLQNGARKSDRTGTGTRSIFGYQMRFNLRDGSIPLLTTKKMFVRGIIREIEWYLQGNTNIKFLTDHNVHIWDEWADLNGDLGPVYGAMWRKWPDAVEDCATEYIDQIAQLIHTLRTNPDNRRMLVTAWNPALLPDTSLTFAENVYYGKQALPPCHYAFQCYSRQINDTSSRELSMILNQRSCDVGLGVPFNIVQYSILLRMIAEVTNHVPGEFIWNGGDVHIYDNHKFELEKQLLLKPYASPTLNFARPVAEIDDFGYTDFVITGYESHPKIDMDVAV